MSNHNYIYPVIFGLVHHAIRGVVGVAHHAIGAVRGVAHHLLGDEETCKLNILKQTLEQPNTVKTSKKKY